MITFHVHHSPYIAAKNAENWRSGVFKYVCRCMVWANCTQFLKKEGLLGWVEGALTALPFIAALSFIQTHKGCVRRRGRKRRGHYLSSQPQKKFQQNRDVFPTSWAVRVLLPEPHPTSQRENPAEIALSSPSRCARLIGGDSVTASRHSLSVSVCLAFFLSQVCFQSSRRIQTHTNPHTPSATWFELNRQHRENGSAGSSNLLQNSAHCLVRQTVRGSVRWSCARTMAANRASLSQPNFPLGLSSLGVLRLDTACHQQARANEIRARLITVQRPLSPLVISWVNDQGPVTLGWAKRGGQQGWEALPLSTIPERR